MAQVISHQEVGTGMSEFQCGRQNGYLDVDLFLDEYPWWEAGGPQCPFILQRMFVHAEIMG